jgi:hypothetical protein
MQRFLMKKPKKLLRFRMQLPIFLPTVKSSWQVKTAPFGAVFLWAVLLWQRFDIMQPLTGRRRTDGLYAADKILLQYQW